MIAFVVGMLAGAAISSWILYQIFKRQLSIMPGAPEYVELVPADKVLITVQIIENPETYMAGRWFQLPINWETMVQLSRLVTTHDFSFTYSLTGREAGNPITRAEYDKLKFIFLEKGLAVHKVSGKPRSGLQLTAAGKAFFRQWASSPSKPTTNIGEWSVSRQEHAHTSTN